MNVLEHFQHVTTFVFDVDGVLTDGTVLLLDNGLQARRMNTKDGLAIEMALRKNYRVLILSGGSSEPVIRRLQYLGVEEVHLGLKDKQKFLKHYLELQELDARKVLFMGDDLPDLEAMQLVGMPCCPADAVTEIKMASKYISPFKGGWGCVRDVIEKVLRLNDQWHYSGGVSSQ